MKVLTYVNGSLVTTPDGVKDLNQEIKYLEEYRGIFNYVTSDLTFYSDGYTALETQVFSSPCAILDFVLKIDNDVVFNGGVDITECEYNITKSTADASIQDDNLSAYVTKNAKIKTYINVTKTKNGEAITAATRETVDFFNPATGSYDYTFANVYPVYDAFRYLVEWMSDMNLTCTALPFEPAGDYDYVYIVNGGELSETLKGSPNISFYDLFNEMNVLFNLAMYIDHTTSPPTLVIDKYQNIYTSTNLYTFTNVRDLIVSFDKSSFYSKVILGSTTIQNYSGGTFTFPDAKFLGFSEEEYFVGGQCNIDNELKLINSWVIDSNVFEDTLVNNNDSYEKDTFIVEVETSQAIDYDNLIPTGKVYNQRLTNFYKAQNWITGVPNSILAYLNNEANNFEATKNSVILATGNLLHPTVITDPGTNYDNVLGKYTCPLGGDGVYTFQFEWSGASYTEPEGTVTATVQLVHYDSGGVPIGSINLHTFVSTIGDLGGVASAGFYLAASDYVRIEATVIAGTTSYGFSTFSGDFADEGGVYQAYDPSEAKLYNIEFETPLTMTQFMGIRDNLTKTITVTSGNNTFIGWVREVSRNVLTGMAKIRLISSNKDNQKRNITR